MFKVYPKSTIEDSGVNFDFRLQELAKQKHWDREEFKQVLIESGVARKYPENTAQTIDIGAFRDFLDDINKKSKITNNEHGRGCFADTTSKKLIFGKVTEGNHESCNINWDKPVLCINNLRRSLSCHSHPKASNVSFSVQDYKHLLLDNELLAEIMTCGEVELIIMKTSVTPSICRKEALDKKLDVIFREFLSGTFTQQEIVRFNKAVCIENGLSLFMVGSLDRNIASKIDLFNEDLAG